MTEVFADTFYWIAFTNVLDAAHEKTMVFSRAANPRLIVTTEEVLTEYLSTVRVIPQTGLSFLAGLMLYHSRPDKGYSLTDCISMETMRQQGVTEILTHDNHFTQEGFTILL